MRKPKEKGRGSPTLSQSTLTARRRAKRRVVGMVRMVLDSQPTGKLDLDQVETWLRMLFGDAQGLMHVSSSGDWAGHAYRTDDVDQALTYVAAADALGREGVYVRMTTLREQPKEGGRGSETDSHYLVTLWSDLDIAGPNHKTTKVLPPDEETCRKIILESGLPEPTLWIATGGGLHPYWFLKTPLEITDRDRVKQLSVAWQKIIAHTAKRLGFFADGTAVADLARIMRIPGTINRKNGATQQCTWGDGGSGNQFEFEALEQRALVELLPLILEAEDAERPKPVAVPALQGSAQGLSPGDDFNQRVSWGQILAPAGWKYYQSWGGRDYWTRPGKDYGVSASTGGEADVMFVFTSSTEFEAQRSYTKFGAFTTARFDGNYSEAAKFLRSKGYGDQQDLAGRDAEVIKELMGDTGQELTPGQAPPMPPKGLPKYKLAVPYRRELNDTGNAERILDRYRPIIRREYDTKSWTIYSEGRWLRGADDKMRILAGYALRDAKFTEVELYGTDRAVDRQGNEKEGSSERDKFLAFLTRSGNSDRTSGAIKQITGFEEVHCQFSDFDTHTHLTNLPNGTLDTSTALVRKHDPADMLTKRFGVAYDPNADCPMWKSFLETNLADEKTREYLQKLVGYTLSGRADQKLMVYMHGPSDTGKTLVAQTLLRLFGEYGYAAPKGSLAPRRDDKGHDPDRDGMAGKRFITTSESRPGEEMDEALVKALTGRDSQETRTNYKELREWVPEGVIWVASNQYPKITGDDDAIWTRIKVIPFVRQFLEGDPDRDNGLQQKLLTELPGILNWAIEGLRKFLAEGLDVAPEVRAAGEEFRTAGDGVQTWLADGVEQGWIRTGEGEEYKESALYADYKQWCQDTDHRTALRPNRFYERLKNHFKKKVVRGERRFEGIALVPRGPGANQWLMGRGS